MAPQFRSRIMGWRQTYSKLTGRTACATARINQVRLDYIAWCSQQ